MVGRGFYIMWPLARSCANPQGLWVSVSLPPYVKCWASSMEEEVLMSQTLCTLSSLGRNSSSEGSHLFRSHGTWTPCHNENQAWRTDLCSGQVRGLHTAIPELPQAFVHLAWKWSLLTYATHTEFICISLSPLGHCGSDLRKGCLGQAPSAAERQTTKATPRSFPEWAEGHRATLWRELA